MAQKIELTELSGFKKYATLTTTSSGLHWSKLGEIYALRFNNKDRTAPFHHNVNFGAFFSPYDTSGTTYGKCFTEFVALIDTPDELGYVFAPSYTASHPVLIGYESNSTNFRITGNMYIDGSLRNFSTDQKFRLGEIYHIAVLWTLTEIKVYVNGLCEYSTSESGTARRAATLLECNLWMGAAGDHSGVSCALLWARHFEETSVVTNVDLNQAFTPSRFPLSSYLDGIVVGNLLTPVFIADFMRPGAFIYDLSAGHEGTPHIGVRGVGLSDMNFDPDDSDLPQWQTIEYKQTIHQDDVTIPFGAKIYDSFLNKENPPFWDKTGGLYDTDGGSLGILTWENSSDFCISQGWAQPKQYLSGLALVQGNSTDLDIRFKRSGGVSCYLNYSNSNNYIFVYHGSDNNLIIKQKIAGTETTLFTGSAGSQAQDFKITKVGGTLKVYTGGTEIKNQTVTTSLTGTKVGIELTTYDLGKIKEFTVY